MCSVADIPAPPARLSSHLTAEEELELVLAMSKAMADKEEQERKRAAEEEEELDRVLKMSLQDK